MPHRPSRRLGRLGHPGTLLLGSLALQALTTACSVNDADIDWAPEPVSDGAGGSGQLPSDETDPLVGIGGTEAGGSGGSSGNASGSGGNTSGGSGGTSTSGSADGSASSGSTGNTSNTGSSSGSGGSGATGSGSGGSSDSGSGGSGSGGSGGSGSGGSGGSGSGATDSSGTGSGASSGSGSVSGGSPGEAGAAGAPEMDAGGAAGAGGADAVEAPAPALDDIVVSVGATFTPAFSSDRTRYSVLPESEQGLALTALANDALTITIGGEPALSGESVPVEQVATGSELEIVVANALGDEQTYTLLLLPTDFPKFTVTTHTPEASTDPLYVTPSSTSSRYVVKLDNYGVPLFYKNIRGRAYDFKKHANGQMSYAYLHADRVDQIVLDANFSEVDLVNCVGVDTDMHEFIMLENGNFILIGGEHVTRDLSSFGGKPNATLVDSILQELSPEREVLFEWNSWDHTDYEDALRPNTGDLAHANSVFVETDGDWIVSLRYMSQVLKLDRSTGDVLWRLGGASSDFEFVNDPWGGLCGQHTVSRLENGHILLFDNGEPCGAELPDRPELTRVVEYELDEVAMTATLVWSYSREGQYAEHQGSAQRLPNGNTVIGWGADQNDPRFVTEVDAAGNIVFELDAAVAGQSNSVTYRARRYPD